MSGNGLDTVSPSSGPYHVLARKYRPSDFDALIGQEPMVRTLTNAFRTGRIAQAWMLTGVRGVGKTTTARILARALNFKTDKIDEPTVELAEFGEHCKAIMEGRHVDVIEMDAASHTGIDDIRDIIDRVRYAPVSARYKVYIIDEVHMLSNQAFNGLLKTLEEPPPHVKFIFATTEIRKVPITVLSRCQRFDLRRVEAAKLVSHLGSIAEKEGISVRDEALAMIARAAEGSVRDSLSILDQAIAHGSGSVDAQAVRDMLGLADKARVIDLFENLMSGKIAEALSIFRDIYDVGADPVVVLADLAAFNHLVTRLRFVPDAAKDPSLTEDETVRGAGFAEKLSVPVLSRTWQMLLKGIGEVRNAVRPVDAAEMVLIRIAHAADLPTLDAALKSLEEAGGVSARPSARQPSRHDNAPSSPANAVSGRSPLGPSGNGGATAMRLVEPQANVERIAPEPAAGTDDQSAPERIIASMEEIAELAAEHRDLQLKILVRRCLRPVRVSHGRLEVNLTDDAPANLLGDLSRKLTQWTGTRWVATHSREQGGPTLHEAEETRRRDAFLSAQDDPTVAEILNRFPGARVIDVRMNEDFAAPDTEVPESGDDRD
jgi:DNA polymerase-3 subunit gamma/tau